ncbi:MAG TPA: M23 family metallopeptidase [Dehalococcoidia bacterium]|jgi:murein DD-endopeptidase MepM/ murein hydrolase activator NlpD
MATVPAAATVPPVATLAPVPTPQPAAPVTTTASDLALLQQRVDLAQQTLDRMMAPPDPNAVQQAADKVAAAQGQLSALQAAYAAAQAAPPTPLPEPTPQPAANTPNTATGTTPQTPDQQLAQAQAQYAAAQQQLQALTQPPDPAAVKAAQDELTAAQQAWQSLLAQANQTVVDQVNADPQNALLRYAASSGPANLPDAVPFAWPAHGPITSFFGPSHPLGVDIAQGPGLPVTAAASGTVTFSGGDPCCSYGYYVDITHPGGYVTRYGHLLTPSYLKPGDRVRQGQILGLSGSTGDSTGPHLHFEIRLNGVPLDPLKLLAGLLPQPLTP